MIAKAEADAAATASRKAIEEEEKKKKEEIAAASKKAKEDAEQKAEEKAKKAKEEHEKKLKEAQTAKEEAEKKQKELEEETKKLKPPPDLGKQIKFKDAVGRKFSFPYHLCKTWKGMEGLIKQAFLHVDMIGDHVRQGHYDLTGPDGEIILPQVWDTMVQPDWEISMHMWPIPEEEKKKDKMSADMLADPFASLGLGGLGDLGIVDPGKKKPKKSDGSKKKKFDGAIPPPPGMNIPSPPNFPPGMLPDPLGVAGIFPPGITPVEEKKEKSRPKAKGKSSSSKDVGGWAWLAGTSGSKSSKKDDEKLDHLVRRKSTSSHGSHRAGSDQVACAVM